MWKEGTRMNFKMIVRILHLTDFEFSIGEPQLVSGVDFGSQSISGRPADSRGCRRRSGSESSPRRSLHASPLETLPSWIRGRRGEKGGMLRTRKRIVQLNNGPWLFVFVLSPSCMCAICACFCADVQLCCVFYLMKL